MCKEGSVSRGQLLLRGTVGEEWTFGSVVRKSLVTLRSAFRAAARPRPDLTEPETDEAAGAH